MNSLRGKVTLATAVTAFCVTVPEHKRAGDIRSSAQQRKFFPAVLKQVA